VTNQANVAHCSQEFQVFRMSQYDMPFGNPLGSRSNLLSMEARTIHSKASYISRRAVLVKLNDFSLERYRILVAQYAGAIIVLLPLKFDDNQRLIVKSLESQLLHEEVKIAVYFISESDKINEYYDYIENDSRTTSDSAEHKQDVNAFQALVNAIFTDGFQFVINSPQSQAISHTSAEYQAFNFQARLNGAIASVNKDQNSNSFAKTSKIPTVIITAHYDAFGMTTCLSYGCDSNGSGVVALLELSRIFSALYSNSKTIPPVNILFLLTAEGKFNYHGIKRWIEEQSETNEIGGKVDLDDVLFAICLDSLGRSNDPSDDTGLYMHVSRPPKEGQASSHFLSSLQLTTNRSHVKFDLVHKKINLASEQLAWEHERFSLNKIPALTLSHFKSFKDTNRATIVDTFDNVDPQILKRNIKLIAHGLVKFIYKSDDDLLADRLLSGDLEVSSEFVTAWLKQICSVPRSASLLLNKNHPLLSNFQAHFSHYLQESVRFGVKVAPKEPEFVFYNEEEAVLVVYAVKPAVFDLFLGLAIACYLGVTYLFVLNFESIFSVLNQRLVLSGATSPKASSYSGSNGVKSKTF
jgi:hypothetical protein